MIVMQKTKNQTTTTIEVHILGTHDFFPQPCVFKRNSAFILNQPFIYSIKIIKATTTTTTKSTQNNS